MPGGGGGGSQSPFTILFDQIGGKWGNWGDSVPSPQSPPWASSYSHHHQMITQQRPKGPWGSNTCGPFLVETVICRLSHGPSSALGKQEAAENVLLDPSVRILSQHPQLHPSEWVP